MNYQKEEKYKNCAKRGKNGTNPFKRLTTLYLLAMSQASSWWENKGKSSGQSIYGTLLAQSSSGSAKLSACPNIRKSKVCL